MNQLLRNLMNDCPSCKKKFLIGGQSVTMNVVFEFINRDYVFCSMSCFDKKMEELKNNPKRDGIIVPSVEFVQKISDYPQKWTVVLKSNIVNVEMM